MFPLYIKIVNDNLLNLSFNFTSLNFKIRNKRYNFIRSPSELFLITMQKIKASLINSIINKKTTDKLSSSPLDIKLYYHSDDNTIDIRNLTLEEAIQFKNCFLDIENDTYKFIQDAPYFTRLYLPKKPMVGFPIFPDIESHNKIDYDCFWLKETLIPQKHDFLTENDVFYNDIDLKKWAVLQQGIQYTPKITDINTSIGFYCIPYKNKKRGQSDFIKSSPIKEAPQLVQLRPKLQNPCNFPEFRICSYNILADLYAKSDFAQKNLFPYCPKDKLAYEYRQYILLHEIKGYQADIVCLQETDKKLYDKFLSTALSYYGYKGDSIYKGETVAEGCALFFKRDKFELVSQHNIELPTAIQSNEYVMNHLKENEHLMEEITAKKAALQVLVLKPNISNDQLFCIANTHLYFLPTAPYTRLIQIYTCLEHLKNVIGQYRKANKLIHLILCGDFNSSPATELYKFVTSKHLPKNADSWPKGEDINAFSGLELHHNFDLVSACGEPEFTNFVPGFQKCIDYIFIEKSGFEVTHVLPFPTRQDIEKYTALPNEHLGSDHLALVCDLKILPK